MVSSERGATPDSPDKAARRRRVPRNGHGHSHSHSLNDIAADLTPMARRIVIGALSVFGLAMIAGIVLLWPSGGEHPIPAQFRGADGGAIHAVDGKIVSQTRGDCLNQMVGTIADTADIPISGAGTGPCIESVVSITSGSDSGKYTLLEVPTNRAQSGSGPDSSAQTLGAPDDPQPGQPTLHIGDAVRMSTTPGPDGQPRYTFFDFGRTTSTIVWAILFAGAIILVAAWRGLRSLIGLVFAFVVLGAFTLPAILDGESPVAVAVVSSAAILFVVLYLAHGISMRTSSALLGTLMSLLLAGVLSWASITTMNLTGLSSDQTTNLQVYQGGISVSGLLLAGFIIGTLGVLNDVTITQASAAFELAAAGEPSRLATFRAAMRVGRDHIASTVYTLVFAYAGSALPLLLLFSVARQPFGSLLTSDTVAVELARSFVGGIAIALSVPLTTGIAAALARPSGARAAEGPAAEVSGTPRVDAPLTDSRTAPAQSASSRPASPRPEPTRRPPARRAPGPQAPKPQATVRDAPSPPPSRRAPEPPPRTGRHSMPD
ncbi:YibE/F family protein [Gordonia polyisoprenivorans]|uniref:YibE/F family protein n=1 Tax=Gordonia polyisoprenivorans TaxID=84595 RepID=UPI000360E45B|nr:YibE/F family protein [Gordonia polyisoprenivorans]